MRELLMPRISLNADEVRITGWRKAPGEEVAAGETVLEVETDKAAMEVESPYTGVLAAVLKQEGEEVRAGELIGYVADRGESLAMPVPPASSTSRQVEPVPSAIGGDVLAVSAIVEQGELGGLPRSAAPSGTAVLRAPAGQQLPRARRAIARTLTRAAAIPQLAVTRELDATAAAASSHSLSDLFAAAVAAAAVSHPRFNAWMTGDDLVQFDTVGLAFAVDSPRGVVAPVLREAERLTLTELAQRRRDLVERAQEGSLRQSELEEATITLTNLGPLGVDLVLPLITPPQVAVVGLGRLREFAGRMSITVSLVADHRVVDGADGARFLATVEAELSRWAGSDADSI